MRVILLLILMHFVGMPAGAQTAPDYPGIRDTISAQVDAFRADDLGRAFGFASPMIQGIFQTPEIFGQMVQNGYPSIWRPEGMIFHDQSETDGVVMQRMAFLDAQGNEHWYAYEMVRDGDAWKINGVYPIDAPDVGV